jgi:hypothetical protein
MKQRRRKDEAVRKKIRPEKERKRRALLEKLNFRA